MVYEMIKKQVIAENETYCKDMLEAIEKRESVLQRESTPTRWKQYQEKRITYPELVEYTSQRIRRKYEKMLQADLETIEACEHATLPKEICIFVEWKKSTIWGYNPHVEVSDDKKRYFGSASGCNYDKLSEAVAICFNQSAQIKKILYDKKEEALKAGKIGNNNEIIGYGAGYGALPSFEGGVGMSCFVKILRDADYKCKYSSINRNQIESYFFYR